MPELWLPLIYLSSLLEKLHQKEVRHSMRKQLYWATKQCLNFQKYLLNLLHPFDNALHVWCLYTLSILFFYINFSYKLQQLESRMLRWSCLHQPRHLFQAASAVVSVQCFLSNTHPSLQRRTWMFDHPAFLDAAPRLWLHPLLGLEDVQAPRHLHVRSLRFLRHRLLILRVWLDRLSVLMS